MAKKEKKKTKPAWRAKYDAANPTVSYRMAADLKAFVDAQCEQKGVSYADFMRKVVEDHRTAEEAYAQGWKKGRAQWYEKGRAEGVAAGWEQLRAERAVQCKGCGTLLDFDPSNVVHRIMLARLAPGECHHPDGQ